MSFLSGVTLPQAHKTQRSGGTSRFLKGISLSNASDSHLALYRQRQEAAARASRAANSFGGVLRNTISGIPGALNTVGITPAFKAGVEQVKSGVAFQPTQPSLVESAERGLNVGAGVFNVLSSPFAPIFNPISNALNAVADKISDNKALQKFAMSPGGTVATRLAEAILNASVVAGGVAGLVSPLKGKIGSIKPNTPVPIGTQVLEPVKAPQVSIPEVVKIPKAEAPLSFEGSKLYHGTDAQFDRFDFSKAGEKGTLYGKGIYLSDSQDIAATYGKNIKDIDVDRASLLLTDKPLPQHQVAALKKVLGEDYAPWDTIPNGEWLWKRLELTHKRPEAVLQKAGINGVEYTPIVKGGANYKNIILYNEKPLKSSPSIPKPRSHATTLKPIKGTGDVRTRSLSAGVEAGAIERKLTDSFGDLPEYRAVNMADQAQQATSLVASDPELARAIAMGEKAPPAGLLPESVYVAVENAATARGDIQLLRDLATGSRLSATATTMGQRIRALGERDENSAVKAIKEIQEARAAARRGTGTQDSIVNQIRAEIRRANTKETWGDFIKSIEC